MAKTFSSDDARVTVKQLDTVATALADASDRRFAKATDMGDALTITDGNKAPR